MSLFSNSLTPFHCIHTHLSCLPSAAASVPYMPGSFFFQRCRRRRRVVGLLPQGRRERVKVLLCVSVCLLGWGQRERNTHRIFLKKILIQLCHLLILKGNLGSEIAMFWTHCLDSGRSSLLQHTDRHSIWDGQARPQKVKEELES